MEVGTVGWFLFPGSPWALGLVVDPTDESTQEGRHEGDDTLVSFYPQGSFGWWTASALAPNTFRRLDAMGVSDVAREFGLGDDQTKDLVALFAESKAAVRVVSDDDDASKSKKERTREKKKAQK